MADPAAIAAPQMRTAMTVEERHWLQRRLHSLSGIIPIGGFLLFHLFQNAYVLRGGAVWWKETEFTRTLSFQVAIEALFLWIPISYHAIYGLVITATAQPNSYPYERNYQYTMQRVTGVIAFLFIGFHVFSTRAWYYLTATETTYPTTGQQLLYALDEQVRRYEVAGQVRKFEGWDQPLRRRRGAGSAVAGKEESRLDSALSSNSAKRASRQTGSLKPR